MADEQMYRIGAYVSDGTGLFEVVRVQKEGPALPRQRRKVTLEACADSSTFTIKDLAFDKTYVWVCQRLTDDELYLRYKAVGKEYTPEPCPKPRLYSKEQAALICH